MIKEETYKSIVFIPPLTPLRPTKNPEVENVRLKSIRPLQFFRILIRWLQMKNLLLFYLIGISFSIDGEKISALLIILPWTSG